MDETFSFASEMERKRVPFSFVTITGTEGITPRKSGRMAVSLDGSAGTVGGGEVERYAISESRRMLKEGKGGNISYSLPLGKVHMSVDIPVRGKDAHIVGFGHVGEEIAKLLYSVGYRVFVYTSEVVDESYCTSFVVKDLSTMKDIMKLGKNSAVVVTVHDTESFEPFLLSSDAFYIGFLGSRMRSILKDRRIMMPIGLDIGAETPEEIAISVVAEILREEKAKSGKSLSVKKRRLVVVRGGGDLATGVMIRLHNAGYDVVSLELGKPTQVRRNVSFAEAMYEGSWTVSGVTAVKAAGIKDIFPILDSGCVAIMEDGDGDTIRALKPTVVVDAILAKRNLGTDKSMAPLVIALGPGFTAGDDVDVVIETKRGHTLGSVIRKGSAIKNTGIPGIIAGYGIERVLRCKGEGIFRGAKTFGDIVKKGDVVAYVGDEEVKAEIDGMVRGILHDGLYVTSGFKVGDIDPRGKDAIYQTPSDKAMAVAGGVLEAVDSFFSSFT